MILDNANKVVISVEHSLVHYEWVKYVIDQHFNGEEKSINNNYLFYKFFFQSNN